MDAVAGTAPLLKPLLQLGTGGLIVVVVDELAERHTEHLGELAAALVDDILRRLYEQPFVGGFARPKHIVG